MDTVSNQLLSRYSFERSPEAPGESSRKDSRIDGHHSDHQAHRAQQRGLAHGIERHRDIEDKHEKHRHHPEHATDTATLAYRRTDRTSLLVETREGDTVRLKIKAHEAMTLEGGNQGEDESPVKDVQLQTQSRVRIAIKIDGDLNEDELAAIQDIIGQAGNMASAFFSGDTADAFATASTLEIDATQLANVRIRMKTSAQLTYPMGIGMPAPARSPQAAGNEPDSGNPAAASPESTTTVAPAVQATAAEASGETAAAENGDNEAANPAAQTTDVTEESETASTAGYDQIMASTLQSIGEFLNNLLSTFAGNSPAEDNSSSSADMTLKLQVFRSMLLSVNELENPASGEPASTLAADTIDAVTAQQAPLNEVA